MDLLEGLSFNGDWLTCFCLLLARTGGWAVMVPLLGAKGIAGFARVAMSVLIALALTELALKGNPVLPEGPVLLLAALVGEFVLGACIGWLCGLLMHAAEMAGGFADFASGMAFAQTVDPNTGSNSASLARLFSMAFLAIAFALNAHHHLLNAFASTVEVIPLGVWPGFDSDFIDRIADGVGALMRAALEIAAPLMGALFITEAALGLISKFYPQANILMLGLGVKALVAMATAGFALALLPPKVQPLLDAGTRVMWGVF